MSKLSGLPDLPASVGGHSVPDFINFEIVGDGKLPTGEVPKEFDFSIKKSPVFGKESGDKFDEGAHWYPLREVKFGLSDAGLGHYQAHYPERSTIPVGQLPSTKSTELKLSKEEYIVGFRAYSSNGVIEGVRIWTNDGTHKDFGKAQGPTDRGKDPEAFFVPPDHEVVNFFGHTNDKGHIHGLGASYVRRLASLAARAPASPSSSTPKLSAFLSKTYLDASTQHSWAINDMATITRKQDQASKDLAPIFQNIHEHGDKAWTRVRDPETKEEYYISWNDLGIIWSYVVDKPSTSGDGDIKNSVISIGSYSGTENMLSVSGYIWENIPSTTVPVVTASAFAILAKELILQGITWGIQYAGAKLAEFLKFVGAEELAVLVPTSLESTGGLVIAGVIAVFVVFGLLGFMSIIFKKFYLTLNIYNFDLDHEWSSVKHHGDNAQPTNGEWKNKNIPTFKPADSKVFPPGFNPRKPMETAVTSLSMIFDNIKVGLQGLGVGVLMGRGDSQAGIACKYIVKYFKDNEIGLKFIDGDSTTFDLEDYYTNGTWVQSQSIQVKSGGYLISGFTPQLGGSDDHNYYYYTSIGLPPPVVR
ncbi:hypothetical protein RSOLAG22IIIB_08854 [Rhizoctonia solani]|uniref:Jacalin-type lectin domain-containing protein n=2 Tax=Rhizoctonia solani TaxID=456999 RepID=A0A0K6FV08_9AGAM|nr:hypothetical protein RSOLAG22IIIB_08854 [Rhizoctonia solani]